jgi:hypothetical protein
MISDRRSEVLFQSLSVNCRVHTGKDDWNVASFLIVSFISMCGKSLRRDQQSIRLGIRILVRRVRLHILVWFPHSWARRDYILATKRLVERIQHP